ncbi:AMP-dependent synthetase [Lujinxingia litoralis]|uniref:AMP-dependent synthetase n=1 Tax=Lujinxingia litoralis TaxID=2211119 RepID=A0A328C8N6_9DELT|nr:AMP-binding protein [Lujinxingia litoralis]RAL22974.1 AMP-dependent synthetase [Lujinxingia litoralis]
MTHSHDTSHAGATAPGNGHINGTAGAHALALPATAPAPTLEGTLKVGESLRGKEILLTGTTGFLGKVVMVMLLRNHPDIEQLYVLVRSRRDHNATERFYDEVVPSGALDPLRQVYGDQGYLDFLREKVTVIDGDICRENLGLELEHARELSSRLDVFINSAGLTNFNPNLRNALEINTLSQRLTLDFLALGDNHARLMHVSTCFVAGNSQKPSPEVFPGPRVYPRVDELGLDYEHEREIDDCLKLIEHFEAISRDQEHQVRFVQEARDFLKKHNLNPGDAGAMDTACERARRNWVNKTLSQEGRKRAAFWGWPNIYTYTKSLGERILADAAARGVKVTIARPAIIESAVNFPQQGWNEGINTTAPICFMMYKGHRFVPTREGVNLDVIPVDHVAGAMLAIAAALLNDLHDDVYHLGSSDLNPISVARLVELSTLGNRRVIDREVKTPGWKKLVLKSMDSVVVEKREFDRQSAPGLKRAAGGMRRLLGRLPTRQLGGMGKAIEGVQKTLKSVESMATTTEKIFELFLPFIYDNRLTFKSQNVVKLDRLLGPAERPTYGCRIADLDWREYWIQTHIPGLARHSYPALEAKLSERNREVYTYDDLVELFDASTSNFARRLALQHQSGSIVERYTYGELKERAERACAVLSGVGVGPGHTCLLVSENRPQWGMTYFGILKTGGIAVPVDCDSTTEQLINVARSARARAIVLSQAVDERLGAELREALLKEAIPARTLTFAQIYSLGLPDPGHLAEVASTAESVELLPADDNDPLLAELMRAEDDGQPLASLIFTSGTTGAPKGVMLTHQNFAHLLNSLQKTFQITERDGFLSVLPLHHTFEFACGFLMPLSRGASITYLEEVNADELTTALTSSRITALIGVPALWQLLHRRIDQRLNDAPPAIRVTLESLLKANTTLRERFGINLGTTFFAPVHAAFGGRLRYMISGAAALPVNILETFYGLGFSLYEGYGLTEAAPVLTVNSPERGLAPGTVGRALDGIEIDIKAPDNQGVGEVIARGPNVMRGYLGRAEETTQALQDGWLHTGDLGKFDERGNLMIVGREKEVIVTAGGKNCYPDELEDLYAHCPDALEISIVGLPDGKGSERVACLVRPDLPENATAAQIATMQSAIREWIRVEGSRVPSHSRIQVLRFWNDEFPRTATRKIKRKDVVKILERLMAAELEAVDRGEVEDTTWSWLDKVLSRLADYEAARIHNNTHLLDDLGFDSLMFVELASILEARDHHVSAETLALIETVGELQEMLDGGHHSTELVVQPKSTLERVEAYEVPPAVQRAVKRALYNGQMNAYGKLFDVDVFGRAHIPYHNPNVIVVANHSSHLDMGLVKYALGDFGTDIRALAAADYFFKNTARKTYFGNFTNLLPVERSGTLENSLGRASEALQQGEMLLLFPEGTRSRDGKLQPFRRGLGYLVDTHKVDVLPLWIEGTHRALPKGQALPSPTARKLKVTIGPLLKASQLRAGLDQDSPTARYDAISLRAHDAVAELGLATRGGGNPEKAKAQADRLSPIFHELNHKFAENQVDSPVSFYFSLGNFDSHKWTITVDPKTCNIQNAKPSGRADCVVKTSPEIFRKIVQESYVPSMDEFMSGVIKTNDPDLLMRFSAVFGL